MDLDTATVPVLIKWGRQRIPVEIDYSESPMVFKAQLMTLTRVPIERQKVIYKGRILDDEEWAGFQVGKDTIMTMVGTDDEIPMSLEDTKAAANQVHEDKPKEFDSIDKKEIPLGFTNLGNTCYMNSSFQLLKCITPIRNLILKKRIITTGSTMSSTENLDRFFKNLEEVFRTSEPGDEQHRLQINVNMLVGSVEALLPEFNQRDKNGLRMQQDANEFLLKIFSIFRDNHMIEPRDGDDTPIMSPNFHNIIESCLRMEYEQVTSSKDFPNYQPTITSVYETILSINIDSDVRDLIGGIKKRMWDVIEMHHEESKQNQVFQRLSLFTRLPTFVCIHLGRFYYKSKQNVCAKVLREVKIPFQLDLFTFCSDNYQKTLLPMRTLIDKLNDKRPPPKKVEKKVEDDDIVDETPEKVEQEQEKVEQAPTPPQPSGPAVYALPEQNLDMGSSGSALYNLKAIVTHKGRYSNSGHYVTWVKITDKVWAKLDDSEVSIVSDEQIKKLYGGGEWHSAYIVLYEAVTVVPPSPPPPKH